MDGAFILVALGMLTLACDNTQRARAVAPVAWEACPFDTRELDTTRIRCGYISVPENRQQDQGRRIRIAFAVVSPSTPGSESNDPFLLLAGGPGATGFVPILLRLAAPALAEDRPYVTFDQRGIGYSEPRMCSDYARRLTEISASDLRGTALREAVKEADLACRDSMLADGIDLRAYHSGASADDVEDLRRALGVRQWVLWGASYGGALAQAVMSRHPTSVRAAVLESPARFDDAAWFDTPRAVAGTLRVLSEMCRGDSACPRDSSNLEEEFYRIAERLTREPFTVPVDSAAFGRASFTVNPSDFVDVIAHLTQFGWELPFVPRVVRAFRDRDTAVVSKAVSQVFGFSEAVSWSPGMQLLVRCHDIAAPSSRSRWQRVVREFPLEGEVGFLLDSCEDLQIGYSADSDRQPRVSQIPTLILSGRFDDRTPPAYSAQITQTFRNSRQIIFPNAAHAVVNGATFECIKPMVLGFARNPAVFPDGACAAKLPPPKLSHELPEWAR